MRRAREFGIVVVGTLAIACGDGSGKAPPPTQSSTVETPLQLTTVYALEQTDDSELTARARYYDALQFFDWNGNAGTIALSPGDAAYADGKRLDIETRTETLGTLRVDYSQTVTKGKPRYRFELRRPNETISASIPAPDPLVVTVVDNADKGGIGATITWEPVVKDSKVSVLLKTESDGCALFEEGWLTLPEGDTGKYEWRSADAYRSTENRQCTFVVTVERRVRTVQPAQWKKGSTELPTNGVHAEALKRGTSRITLRAR